MSINDSDARFENLIGGKSKPSEETDMNLFLAAYQPGSNVSDTKIGLNDATNINQTIRWFNEQYSKLGGGLGNLYTEVQDDEPKPKTISITDRK